MIFQIKSKQLLTKLKWFFKTPVFKIGVVLMMVTVVATVSATFGTKQHDIDMNEASSVGDQQAQVSSIQCEKEFSLPDDIPTDTFQHVQGRNIYVFSAYLDRRTSYDHKVRVIALSHRNPQMVYCEIHYENDFALCVPAVASLALPVDEEGVYKDSGSLEYKPYMFSCNETTGMPIKALSLTKDSCETPSNTLLVRAIHGVGATDYYTGDNSRAICIKTLHQIKSPYRVIEFFEMQIQLGITHIFVYKLGDFSSLILPVIRYYESMGKLTQINWDLPIPKASLPTEEIEIAINNDCIYRTMNNYELVFVHDFDEFVIPRRPQVNTIKELLYSIHEHNNYHLKDVYASYSFNECLYCLKILDNEQVCPTLFALKRQKRHMCLKVEIDNEWWQDVIDLKAKQLATRKSIVHPKRVILMGANFILQQVPGFKKEFKIPTYFASVNHYKYQNDNQMKCNTADPVVIDKYSSTVKSNINKVCALLDLDEVP